MKKYLLSLLALFSLQAMAMVEETATFNFKEPLNLNLDPELDHSDKNLLNPNNADGGSLVNITQHTITTGPVVISFSKPAGTPGAHISRYGQGAPFCLEIGRLLSITFNLTGGCVLKSVNFDQDSDITLPSGQPGSWNYMTNTWTADDNSTTSVTLKNGDQSAKIYTIKVKYLRPSTPMTFLSSSPAANETYMGSFKSMTLNFSSSVAKVNNASNIKLTGTDIDGTAINESMTASYAGSTVTLSIQTALVKDADLKVTAPAGTFENAEGATNQEAITIPFKLLAKRDIFNPTKIEPAAGSWNALPKEIKLTFTNFVKAGTGSIKFKQTDGDLSFSVDASTVTVENNVATIKHDHTVVDASKWTVDIPAKAFHNDFAESEPEYRWNAAFSIEYEVDGSAAGPQDSQTMKDAKALLKKTGVGYPLTTDPLYKALDDLVKSDETPTDEALQAAMTALYNATNVQLPEVGEDKWYNIVGINKDGKKIYLTFSDDKTKVVLGTDAANAAAFKVKSVADGKVVFQTKEGLFLHVPTVLPQHEGTTDANLTAEESAVNQLTLSKFLASSVEGADPAALYGAFTIYGSLGKVSGMDVEDFAYAMLDYDNNKVVTYPNVPLTFNSQKSSAFVITNGNEPTEVVDLIYPTVGFVPDVIDNPGDEIIMKVYGPTTTTIADASLIYYTKHTDGSDNGTKVAFTGTILTPVSGQANTFKVNTTGLVSGMYNLVMENGAFTYTAPAGKGVRPVMIVGGPITIKSGSGEITPTATLSKTQLKAGDDLVLKIGNVAKAVLKTPTAPYFEYAEGDKAGTKVTFSENILTSKANTTADFSVNTKGLAPAKYKLVMPSETFIFEAAQAGQTVKENVQLVVTFEILNEGGTSGDEGFVYNFDGYISYLPASRYRTNGYFKDIDLNEMYVYVFESMASGMVANPEKKVQVVTNHGGVAAIGHFENYDSNKFVQEFTAYIPNLETEKLFVVKYVADDPVKAGDLDNWKGYYTYRCEPGALGDANYGKWLKDHNSVKPEDCRVSPALEIGNVLVWNDGATTGITDAKNETSEKVIFDLQGRRVQNMDKKGVYIVNGRKVVNK